jgi:rare lipoprotein A
LSETKTWRRRVAGLQTAATAALVLGTASQAAQGTTAPQLGAAKHHIRIGERVRLYGRFPGTADAAVQIRQRKAGRRHWRVVRRLRTDAEGRFALAVRPSASGAWRAQLPGETPTGDATPVGDDTLGTTPEEAATSGSRTPLVRIPVRSRVRARVSTHNAVVGRRVVVAGRVRPAGPRRIVVRMGGERNRTRTGRDGRFEFAWTPRSTGSYRLRVVARGNRLARGSRDRVGRLDVFRPVAASWYGPGFYGGRTACGQTLTSSTLGVANRTLPCGAKVRLRYGGREVRVPVIDRGPYAGDRELDLTEATKNRLGFGSTGTVLSSR